MYHGYSKFCFCQWFTIFCVSSSHKNYIYVKLTGHFWGTLSLTGPYWSSLSPTRPYGALLGHTGHYWALLSIMLMWLLDTSSKSWKLYAFQGKYIKLLWQDIIYIKCKDSRCILIEFFGREVLLPIIWLSWLLDNKMKIMLVRRIL